jgi:alkylation response protein AidB-like acyl-CoA dehydrogenase
LQTRAVRDGDHYVVNGQKTWTTLAQHADWGFFLVRTDPKARKQAGISFLLIDMKSPGVSVRPIITLDGAHEVNEVWLENVRVPVENRVYEENKGWTCAKMLLSHERSGIAMVARSKALLAELRAIASGIADGADTVAGDPVFRRKLTEVDVELTALEYTELRMLAAENAGKAPGVEASMLKIRGTEIRQRLNELLLEAMGAHASLHVSAARAHGENAVAMPAAVGAADTYFNMRKITIFGGSNEIQRNILSKAVLGL